MKSRRNIILSSGFLVIGLSTAYSSMFGTAYSWLGGNGNWNDAAKWNPNGVPDSVGEEAQISAAGTYTVTMNISPSIDTASITNAGTTLNMGANTLTLNAAGGFSNAGTIQTGGANAINLLSGSAQGSNAATGTISVNQNTSLTLGGNLWQNNGSILINPQQVGNPTSLSFNGTTSLSGNGLIQLSQNSATLTTTGGSTLVQGASHTIQGRGAIQAALTNNGNVFANWNNNVLSLNTRNMSNNGIFSAAGGGTMLIAGITVTQGPTAQLFANGGEIYLNGATIVGGLLTRTGSSAVRNQFGSTNRLTGTTINGLFHIEQNSTAELAGAQTVNNGTISLNPEQVGNPTRLHLTQGHTLAGTGILTMNSQDTTAEVSGAVGATLTHASTHTISGRGRISVPFANAGTINASWNGQTLNVTGGAKTNTGLMTATAGGALQLSSTTLQQSGAGQLFANGGNISVVGSTVSGGTVNTASPSSLLNFGTSTFSNFTNNGDVRITQNSNAAMFGTVTNNGTISLNPEQVGNPTFINATNALTFTGTGTIAMSANGTQAEIKSTPGISVTNSSGHTIAGRGQISAAFVNAGTVNASWGGLTLLLIDQNKQNSNLMTATATGTLQLSGMTLTQTGTGRLFANGGNVLHSGNSKVVGGKLQSAGSTYHIVSSGPANLENVTNEGALRISQNNQLNLIGSALNNTGTITVNPEQVGNPTKIQLANSLSINGSGAIGMNAPSSQAEIGGVNPSVVLTHGAGHTISGRGRISVNTVNNGTIDASWGAQILEVTAAQVTNSATMQATATGTLNFVNSIVTQGANGTIQPLSGNVILSGSTTVNGGKFLASSGSNYVYMQTGTSTIGNLTNEAEIRIPQNNVGRVNGNVVNTGSIQINNEQVGNPTRLDIIENATISGAGFIQLRSFGTTAQVLVATDKTLTLGVGQTLQGRGRVTGQVVNQGNIRANWGAQTLELIPTQSGISNEGLIRVESTGNLTLTDGAKFVNKGDFIIDPAHTATFASGDFKQTSGAATLNGTLDLAPGAKLEADGGIVKGSGVLDGNLQNDAGDVQPGASAGKLRVQGTFSQASTGKTTIEIGGTTPITQHDVLEVTGAATLGGTLKIKLINNFTPASGTTFTVLTGSSVSGTFSNIEFEGTSDSEPSVLYTANAVIVTFLTKVNPTSVMTIDGIPFGGNLNSLFTSDDDWYSTLCDEENVNGKVEITTTSPVATLSNLRFAFETGATRSDLTERIEMFNYVSNTWVTVGPLISTNLGDRRRVVVQATNMSQFVRAGDRQMKVRVSWVPQTDLEISDGWGINIDQAAWFISE